MYAGTDSENQFKMRTRNVFSVSTLRFGARQLQRDAPRRHATQKGVWRLVQIRYLHTVPTERHTIIIETMAINLAIELDFGSSRMLYTACCHVPSIGWFGSFSSSSWLYSFKNPSSPGIVDEHLCIRKYNSSFCHTSTGIFGGFTGKNPSR